MILMTEKIKDFKKSSLKIYRQFENDKYSKTTIIVHLGICGAALGAQEIYDLFQKLVSENNLTDQVILKKAGCIGLCSSEPLIQVNKPGLPPAMYSLIDEEMAEVIFTQHVINGVIISPWLLSTRLEGR